MFVINVNGISKRTSSAICWMVDWTYKREIMLFLKLDPLTLDNKVNKAVAMLIVRIFTV